MVTVRKLVKIFLPLFLIAFINYFYQWNIYETKVFVKRADKDDLTNAKKSTNETFLGQASRDDYNTKNLDLNPCPEPPHLDCNVTILLYSKNHHDQKNTNGSKILGYIYVENTVVYTIKRPVSVAVVALNQTCHILKILEFQQQKHSELNYLRAVPSRTIFVGASIGYTYPYLHIAKIWDFKGSTNFHKYSHIDKRTALVAFTVMGHFPAFTKAVMDPTGTDTLRFERMLHLGHAFDVKYKSTLTYSSVRALHGDMKQPFWSPTECKPKSTIAIIVPYRNRKLHLSVFLENIIRFLQLQKLAFHIYVIEQAGEDMFNRAALMNAGYLAAKEDRAYDCYIFHDVDSIPEDLANYYGCTELPRHLMVTRSQTKYRFRKIHERFIGGAMSLTSNVIEDINGFPNRMFGWGGEDDDIYDRLVDVKNYTILRQPTFVGRYYSLPHKRDVGNPKMRTKRKTIDENIAWSIQYDGLNTSDSKFIFLGTKHYNLYTNISVLVPMPTTTKKLKGKAKKSKHQNHTVTTPVSIL